MSNSIFQAIMTIITLATLSLSNPVAPAETAIVAEPILDTAIGTGIAVDACTLTEEIPSTEIITENIEDAEIPLAAFPEIKENEDDDDKAPLAEETEDTPDAAESEEESGEESSIENERPYPALPCCTTVEFLGNGMVQLTNTHGGFFVQVTVTEDDFYNGTFSWT